MDGKIKTRNLSYYQYFIQLQTEYIVSELRKKIYPSPKDKKYYQRVMEGKKKIIEDIALRNSLKSIFSDESEKRKEYLSVYKNIGFPDFNYKTEQERVIFEVKDKNFYYMKGAEFRITIDKKEKIGKLLFVSFKTSTAGLEFEDSKEKNIFGLDYITRIL
jgi:hypothetical protein